MFDQRQLPVKNLYMLWKLNTFNKYMEVFVVGIHASVVIHKSAIDTTIKIIPNSQYEACE